MSDNKKPGAEAWTTKLSLGVIAVSATATLVTIICAIHEINFQAIPHTAWLLVPHAVLALATWRYRKNASSLTMLLGVILISGVGTVWLIDAIFIRPLPSVGGSLLLGLLPLYQLFAIPVVVLVALIARRIHNR